MDFWELRSRREAVKKAEAAGRVADSLETRKKLMDRVKSGELTLEQVQAHLERIKRSAKSLGLITRDEAWNGE